MQVQNDPGLEIGSLKSREKLRNVIEAMKNLVTDQEKGLVRTVVEKIRFGTWRVMGDKQNYMNIADDQGYPTCMSELEAMVNEDRLGKFGVTKLADKYLEYLTGEKDLYKTEVKDWGTFAGKPKEDPVKNSAFFIKKVNDKMSPAQMYRHGVISTRETMSIYLRDDYVKTMFFTGVFRDWQDFEKKISVMANFGDGIQDHDAPSIYRKRLKEILSGESKKEDTPRLKYAALSTLVEKYYIHEKTTINSPVWEGDEVKFQGPDDKITPAFHMLLMQLACLQMDDGEFQNLELEFKRVNKDYAPKTMCEKRPHFLQLMADKKNSESVSVRKVQEEKITIAKVEEIEDVDDFDDMVLEEFDTGRVGEILAIREKKFGNRNSTRLKKSRPFFRLQKFARAVRPENDYQKNGKAGGHRNASQGDWKTRKICTYCPGEKKHTVAECPRGTKKPDRRVGVSQVNEEEQKPETNEQDETEYVRSVMGTSGF